VSDILLNKETLEALASSPNLKRFGFLAPVRNRKRTSKKPSSCSGCPVVQVAYMTDAMQEVVLQSLVPGGSYNNEVSGLKQVLVCTVLVLPTQRGLIRI
jgi:hypothetical protein